MWRFVLQQCWPSCCGMWQILVVILSRTSQLGIDRSTVIQTGNLITGILSCQNISVLMWWVETVPCKSVCILLRYEMRIVFWFILWKRMGGHLIIGHKIKHVLHTVNSVISSTPEYQRFAWYHSFPDIRILYSICILAYLATLWIDWTI
jgi:hypothetical protein